MKRFIWRHTNQKQRHYSPKQNTQKFIIQFHYHANSQSTPIKNKHLGEKSLTMIWEVTQKLNWQAQRLIYKVAQLDFIVDTQM